MRVCAWLVARRSWRRDAGSLLLVAVLAGVSVGAAVALVEGAGRTRSAFDRFAVAAHDIDTGIVLSDADPATIERLRALPGVRGSMLASFGGLLPDLGGEDVYAPTLIDRDGAYGREVNRGRVIRGRFADPSDPHEITLDEPLAATAGLDVGDTLTVRSFTPHQVELDKAGESQAEPRGPTVDLEVVGIVRQPANLLTDLPMASVVAATPAFGERYGDRIGEWGRALFLDIGAPGDDASRFVEALHNVPGYEETQLATLPAGSPLEPTLDFSATAMVVLAATVAIAGIGAAAVALVRVLASRASDDRLLAALGATPGDRVRTHLLGIAPAVVATALTVPACAAIVSTYLPFGLARRADPDLGVHLDAALVTAGSLGAALLMVALTVVGARRAMARAERDPAAAPSGLLTSVRRVAPVAARIGVGLAFDRRRGPVRLPTRTAVAGVVFGTATLLTVVVVAASIDRLLASPEAQGLTWDVKFHNEAAGAVVDAPGVVSVADVRIATVEVGGVPLEVRGIDVLQGDPPQRLLEGRAATGPREIVLGTRTMGALGVDVGDAVPVGDGAEAALFTVVGRGVFAGLSDLPLSGDAGSMRGDELWRLVRGSDDEGFVMTVVDLAPGTDVDAVRRLVEGTGFAPADHGFGVAVDEPVPVDIERLHSVEDFPWVLTVFLGAVALLAVGHATLSLVRRRRHDLAILRSLGLRRAAVAQAVVVQAALVVGVGLLVGVPLGLAAGQAVWRFLAGEIGVPAEVDVPWSLVVAVPVLVVAVVCLLALLPARAAARTRPAAVLRTE